jgi:hypothetical protein
MTRILFTVGVLLLLPLCSAEARPRDDVMAQLFHCNGLGDDRQWLDCYYGAAQPVRAGLGLKAALPGQIQLAQTPSMVSSQLQPSAIRSQVISEAGRCYDQGEDRDWLECYYRAALPMREQLGLSVPSGMQLASSIPGNSGAAVQSGLATDQTIVSRMVNYSFDLQGIFTVTLENGQTWRQIDGDSRDAFWTKPAGAYLVTIRHGMSGSFMLTVRNESRVYRVRRIS